MATIEQGIVQPVAGRHTPKLGPLAIMAATEADFQDLRSRMDLPNECKLLLSRICYRQADPGKPSLVGPVMGAPYAVMLMEVLHAWGIHEMLFYGWCGSTSSAIRSGDILLPDGAVIDEGTSRHYQQETGATVHPQDGLRSVLKDALESRSVPLHSGLVWTTDGIFRETPSRVKWFQAQGAVAVDMELSALISAALFLDIALASVLLVSDELFDLQWHPGFKSGEFKASRTLVCDLLSQINGNWFHG
ncbi:MAG: nucleoside phosphorylase [Desulfobacteraceae bacterium]|jgi:hypothetical protein